MKQKDMKESKCSGSTKAIHSWLYIGNLDGNSIYRCENCSKLKKARGNKIVQKERPLIQLSKTKENQIIITGKKLSCEWLDSFILIWSGEEHKYRK